MALLMVSTKQAEKGNEHLSMKWLYLAFHSISIGLSLLICQIKNRYFISGASKD